MEGRRLRARSCRIRCKADEEGLGEVVLMDEENRAWIAEGSPRREWLAPEWEKWCADRAFDLQPCL